MTSTVYYNSMVIQKDKMKAIQGLAVVISNVFCVTNDLWRFTFKKPHIPKYVIFLSQAIDVPDAFCLRQKFSGFDILMDKR